MGKTKKKVEKVIEEIQWTIAEIGAENLPETSCVYNSPRYKRGKLDAYLDILSFLRKTFEMEDGYEIKNPR